MINGVASSGRGNSGSVRTPSGIIVSVAQSMSPHPLLLLLRHSRTLVHGIMTGLGMGSVRVQDPPEEIAIGGHSLGTTTWVGIGSGTGIGMAIGIAIESGIGIGIAIGIGIGSGSGIESGIESGMVRGIVRIDSRGMVRIASRLWCASISSQRLDVGKATHAPFGTTRK